MRSVRKTTQAITLCLAVAAALTGESGASAASNVILHLTGCAPTQRPAALVVEIGIAGTTEAGAPINQHFARRVHFYNGKAMAEIDVPTGAYIYSVSFAAAFASNCYGSGYLAALAGHPFDFTVAMCPCVADPINSAFVVGTLAEKARLEAVALDPSIKCGDKIASARNRLPTENSGGAYYVQLAAEDPKKTVTRIGLTFRQSGQTRYLVVTVPVPLDRDHTLMNALPTFVRLDITDDKLRSIERAAPDTAVCV